jgi:hypothetical protein
MDSGRCFYEASHPAPIHRGPPCHVMATIGCGSVKEQGSRIEPWRAQTRKAGNLITGYFESSALPLEPIGASPISHHGSGSSPWAHSAQLWSAAACCRFCLSQLAGCPKVGGTPWRAPMSSRHMVLSGCNPRKQACGEESGSKLPHSKAALNGARCVERGDTLPLQMPRYATGKVPPIHTSWRKTGPGYAPWAPCLLRLQASQTVIPAPKP